MIKLFDFLYYCLYRMFALFKRVGEKDENLTSSFFSILLTTNTIMLFFPLKFIIPKGFFNSSPLSFFLKIIFIGIFICWYLICKAYFLKNENYKRIISLYDKKYVDVKINIPLLGILYAVCTFISFICLAVILSHMMWHL